MDQFVETSYNLRSGRGGGLPGKVSASLCGLCLGPFLVLGGSVLLWQNEKWAIKTHRSLDAARDSHVRIADANVMERDKEGMLVHVTGPLAVEGSPSDEVFGLHRPCAVSLTRHVEIYQWEETRRTRRTKLSNGATQVEDVYSYDKRWANAPVTQHFQHPQGHENYGDVPFGGSQTFRARDVHLGAYTLTKVFTDQLRESSPVPIQQTVTLPLGGSIRRDEIYLPFQNTHNTLAMSSRGLEPAPPAGAIEKQIVKIDGDDKIVHVVKSTNEQYSSREDALEALMIEKKIVTLDGEDSIVYIVKSTGDQYSTREKALAAAANAPPPPQEAQLQHQPQQQQNQVINYSGPQIGDVRVRFSEVSCYVVSVLGQLRGTILSSWPSPEGEGYDVNILTRGQMSAAGMVETWQTFNWYATWFKRFCGWLLAFLGFGMLTSIVSTVADVGLSWIPFLGPMTASIISLGVTIGNFILASTTAFLVAGLSWVVYRPLLGGTMLMGSAGIFFLAAQSGRRKSGSPQMNVHAPVKTNLNQEKDLRLAKLYPDEEFHRPKTKPY